MVTIDQPAGEIVDVAEWDSDDRHPTYPVGSKPKTLRWSSPDEARPYLRPNHRYLFKEADDKRPLQVWSEVIAYRLANLVGSPVPPAIVAMDSRTGIAGVLIEYFLGYQGEPEGRRLVHAADLMQGLLDRKRGRPHGVLDNTILCRAVKARAPHGIRGWWAEALAFDAMIGNRDRHPENWGFLVHAEAPGKDVFEMMPLYDNGVSLGYEIPQRKFTPAWSVERAATYARRGVHHCGWTNAEDQSAQHAELCGQFVRSYPSVRPIMQRVSGMIDADVAAVLEWATTFDGPLPFTPERAAFVRMLTRVRREALLAALED